MSTIDFEADKDGTIFCPVCGGSKKWHRDGNLCSLPAKAIMGIACTVDHTVCMYCKGIGKVKYELVTGV
jgi:hypothetical protein